MSDPKTTSNDVERWRALASGFRQTARKMANLESRRLMEAYAADYERKIEWAEREAKRRGK